jgi:chemotaxis family two-component system sensor kinase Cph1
MHGRDEFGGGVGAGLTIAQKLVQRHGGQIWIDSSLGQGTTVYFTLAGPSAEHG